MRSFQKHLFISMLCMCMGGSFIASADAAKPTRKPLNNSPKVAAPKTVSRPVTAKPKAAMQQIGTWTTLNNPPPFPADTFPGVSNPLLLTDGTILIQNLPNPGTGAIWKLTPDAFGNYINGTWSQLASLPVIDGIQYNPFAFASAVLADGRVIFEGGEYNGPDYAPLFTGAGAIYDPVANIWTAVAPPPFFPALDASGPAIGDAASVILEDGTFMLQSPLSKQAALWNPKSSYMPVWTETGTATKFDLSDEEGWTLLPNGKVLTIDCYAGGPYALITTVTTDQIGVGPFDAVLMQYSPVPATAVTGTGAVAAPDILACAPLTPTIPGCVGVCIRDTCPFTNKTTNIEAAGGIATIVVQNTPNAPFAGIGVPTGTGPSVMISQADGNVLINAINSNPNIQVSVSLTPNPDYLPRNSELYDPKTGTWNSGGNTIVQLTDEGTYDGLTFRKGTVEIGSQVLRPDGTVFVCGGTNFGNTGIYDSKTGIWKPGPKLPLDSLTGGQLSCQDAPGALLPNGNVLFAACNYAPPLNFNGSPPTHFFEFDGFGFTEQPTVPGAESLQASAFQMLVLPTGQILMTNVSATLLGLSIEEGIQIYTPSDRSYNCHWAPEILCAPKKVRQGNTCKIKGIRFNGMSQGSLFGDDFQAATNYPLVRITNKKTGHVFYCRTHDHSFMGVASDREVTTYFDVPANIETGKSTIEVVANGIPSKAQYIYVKSA